MRQAADPQRPVSPGVREPRHVLRSAPPPVHDEREAQRRRPGQTARRDVVVRVEHAVGRVAGKDGEAVRPGPHEVGIERIRCARRVGVVRRGVHDREETAAAAVQEQDGGDHRVRDTARPAEQGLVAVAVEVHLDVTRAHPGEPPLDTRDGGHGDALAKLEDRLLRQRRGRAEVEPEGRLVGALQVLGPEGADRAREAREERRGKRSVLDADERTPSIALRPGRRHSIEIMWPAPAGRIVSER